MELREEWIKKLKDLKAKRLPLGLSNIDLEAPQFKVLEGWTFAIDKTNDFQSICFYKGPRQLV